MQRQINRKHTQAHITLRNSCIVLVHRSKESRKESHTQTFGCFGKLNFAYGNAHTHRSKYADVCKIEFFAEILSSTRLKPS